MSVPRPHLKTPPKEDADDLGEYSAADANEQAMQDDPELAAEMAKRFGDRAKG